MALVALFATGCGADNSVSAGPLSFPGLAEAFVPVDSIHLEEAAGDTIAEIGPVSISRWGEWLIGDRYLPRIRRYDSTGAFVASQGRFGDGPFEYRRLIGVARDERGHVFVHSMRKRAITVLNSNLEPDTVLPVDAGFGWPALGVHRYADGVVHEFTTLGGGRSFAYRDSTGTIAWSIPAGPQRIHEVPYWSSVVRYYAAAAGPLLVTGNSLLYPIRIYDEDGTLVHELSAQPPSFREVPELELGALAGLAEGGGRSALEEWIDSFTVITGLHVVKDRWLVVSHGRIADNPPLPPFQTEDRFVDVYDLSSFEKVVEDVPVARGARVLGGGPYLHVLVAIPPEPWTVVRFDVPQGGW